jgi:hypothetical protein
MILDIDKIRSAGRDTREVEVPEWGGSVVIQELSLAELRKVGDAVENKGEGSDDVTRLLLKYGVVEPALDDETLDHIINNGGVRAASRLAGLISDLQTSAATQEDREASF